MKEIVDFLLHYYREIILVISLVLQVVILFVKRMKINYKLPSSWFPDLINMVAEAEAVYGEGHGRQKLNYVVEKMAQKLNFKYSDNTFKWMVEEMVNMILNTPTKKGGPGRDEEA